MRLVSLHTLRSFVVGETSRLTARQKGSLIRHYLADAIASMTGIEGYYEFQGEPVSAADMRRVLRLLLKFEGTGQDATNRRERVLHLLRLNYPVDQLRRAHSPERELLRLLAAHIVTGNHQSAA